MSMQMATHEGLVSITSPGVKVFNCQRHAIKVVYGSKSAESQQSQIQALLKQWGDKMDCRAAAVFLKRPDVAVTNQGDKDFHIPKLEGLDTLMKSAFEQLSIQAGDVLAAAQERVSKLAPDSDELKAAREAEERAAWAVKRDTTAKARAVHPNIIHREMLDDSIVEKLKADGEYLIYGCCLKRRLYTLPFCLHVCLCPHQTFGQAFAFDGSSAPGPCDHASSTVLCYARQSVFDGEWSFDYESRQLCCLFGSWLWDWESGTSGGNVCCNAASCQHARRYHPGHPHSLAEMKARKEMRQAKDPEAMAAAVQAAFVARLEVERRIDCYMRNAAQAAQAV